MTSYAEWIRGNYPQSTELIHTPAGPSCNLRNGARFDWSPATDADHNDHVH